MYTSPIIGYYIYYNNDKNYTKNFILTLISSDILLHIYWLSLLFKKVKKKYLYK